MTENSELPIDDVESALARETADGPGDLDNLPEGDFEGSDDD